MSDNENDEPTLRRSARNRTQQDGFYLDDPSDFLGDEVNEKETAAEKVAEDNGPSNDSSRRVKPAIHRYDHWSGDWSEKMDEFSSVDVNEKLFYSYRWGGGGSKYLHWSAKTALEKAEEALIAEQDEEHTVSLEVVKFGSESKVTQVPYHASMLPHFDYFAEGIQQHSSIETFKIANHHLPPSWLGNNILPVLEMNSNKRIYEGNMTTLKLSNCGLSGDDLAALATFLVGNTTLRGLDISRNNIDSVDTCKTLAKAIKKNPRLQHINLAHCSLGGGNHDVLNKLLVACKGIDSLEIGHSDFDSKGVAMIANKFLGKKIALTSFSLIGAPVDKENKKLLEEALAKNKTVEKLCFRSNGLQLPGILRATKKITESLSRLTHLDLSFNALPVQGAKVMAKFLEKGDSSLVTLIMTNNHLTVKGANLLLPALTENTTLENLDLSKNWLSDAVAPAVIDLLQNNSTLRSLDLSANKSLKTQSGGNRRWNWRTRERERTPARERGGAEIVKGALFDTESLSSLANSNHSCAVTMGRFDKGDTYEETIRKINALEVSEGKKIRYKVVLAMTKANKDLYDLRSFNDIPLELMPYLLEMVQQELGVAGFGKEVVAKSKRKKDRSKKTYAWEARTRKTEYTPDPTLHLLFELITSWHSLPLLFVRGGGELPKKKVTQAKKKKNQSKSRKRKRFGDEDDDDDEAYVPRGARTTARWGRNPDTGRWGYMPPPPEFR